jgi:hypothetical protein
MFFRLCLQLVNKTEALMAVLILGFATPFWYYAGSLFPAVLLTLLMIISIDGYWRRRRVWMVGLMVGLMVMIKAVYGVVWVGLMLDSWLRREFKAVVLIGLGGLVSIVVLLGMNGFFYGQADFFPVIGNVWELSTLLVNNPWTSLAGLVGGKNTGLVVFSPFLLVWPWMVVNTKIWQLEKLRELLMIPGLVVVAFSFWPGWDGGYAFGYRQMLPMVPLLILSLVWWWGKNRHHGLFNGMVVCLLLLSFLNQAWSMMVDPGEIWSKPPVVLQVLGFASNNLD